MLKMIKENSYIKIDPPTKAKCKKYKQCEKCTYANHGFICWGDNFCIKTKMNSIYRKDKAITRKDKSIKNKRSDAHG